MRKFILKVFGFVLLVLAVFLLILSKADGYTDPFYIRFTTPVQENLILGTSRSAQALQPEVFKEVLGKNFFNYSFTIDHSPFGPVYLNSIRSKLDTTTKQGVFILAVDPWSISQIGENPNDTLNFSENGLALSETRFVNMNPNFEYLLEQFKGRYFKLLTDRKVNTFLHDDGWLEVNVAMDSASCARRLHEKIKDYRSKYLPNRKLSQVRMAYLQRIVDFLKMHGKVYLIRLPVSSEMLQLEQELMPNFNSVIQSVALSANGYIDMTSENLLYQYTDGNHLWKESGNALSRKIAEWIKQDDVATHSSNTPR